MISETAVQNGLMAAAYCLLFVTLLHSSLRRVLVALLTASLLSCIYNIFYDSAIHHRWTVSLALFVRLLPPFEAMWLIMRRNREWRAALVCLAMSMIWCCSNPLAISGYGYLNIRSIATVGMTAACIITVASNHVIGAAIEEPLSKNLILQCFWMILHAVFSLLAPWYTENWSRRAIARWIYVLAATVVVLAYVRLIQRVNRNPGSVL